MDIKEPAVKYKMEMWPAEYIAWERGESNKHEYAEGKIIAMAGASPAHNKILTNLIVSVGSFLRGKPCDIYPGDLRIFVKSKVSYFYPDATIICGDLEFSDDKKDTVKNPAVIFEILSPATEEYDIGRKSFYYMQIESLQQYITVSSTDRHIQSGIRQPDGAWKFQEITHLTESLHINPILFNLQMKDIYDGV